MRILFNSARGAALILVLMLVASAEGQKPLSKTESVTAKATIEAIDKTNRLVTLKGPRGNLVIVEVSKDVKRFDELKVGDVVTATYSESIAVSIRKPGEPAPPSEQETLTARKEGPGATATVKLTASVVVEEIDRSVPSVTVRQSDGTVLSFRIRDVKNIEQLKIGDTVDITYTVAFLLKADPLSK
jgi:hypothetical protein